MGATRVIQEALAGALERWIAEHVLDEDRRLAAFVCCGESAAA